MANDLTPEQEQWFAERWGDSTCAHSFTTPGCQKCLLRYAKALARSLNDYSAGIFTTTNMPKELHEPGAPEKVREKVAEEPRG